MSSAFVALQRVLPQHTLSRLLGRIANSPLLSRPLIHAFSAAYGVSLQDARRGAIDEYRTFNDFFTRSLAAGARPLPEDPTALASPADGVISQLGSIADGQLLQAKGIRYPLPSLLRDQSADRIFDRGWFATIYLAPADYHRVHVPCNAKLVRSVAVPGELFSVNASTEAGVVQLFCRNERLVMQFDTAVGTMALVMVGALIVASIETVFGAPQSPYAKQTVSSHDRHFSRGEEIGRFLLGSTVILILPRAAMLSAPRLVAGQRIRMGEALGMLRRG